MMGWDELEAEPIVRLFSHAGVNPGELCEADVIAIIQGGDLDRVEAAEVWEKAAEVFRRGVVRNALVYEWNLFRRVLRITKLPRAEEIERVAELYSEATPHEIDKRILSLNGVQFERLLAELLGRMPQFSGVYLTRMTGDGGIDIGGSYIPDPSGPRWNLRGQAKRVSDPIGAGQARDFIGALETSRETKVVGLYVSTGGFSKPAYEAFRQSGYQILLWSMADLRANIIKSAVGIQHVRVDLQVPDETFWDEIRGSTKTS